MLNPSLGFRRSWGGRRWILGLGLLLVAKDVWLLVFFFFFLCLDMFIFVLLLPSVHASLYPVPALVCFSLLPRYFIFCTLAC